MKCRDNLGAFMTRLTCSYNFIFILFAMVYDSWGWSSKQWSLNSCLGYELCRMAVAFRPLQPCVNLLLHRSISLTRHACLRVGSAQVPTRYKINAFRADSSKVRSHSQGSAPRASSSDDAEQVLGLARQAIPQTFAPHSVVCSLTSTQH